MHKEILKNIMEHNYAKMLAENSKKHNSTYA